MYCPQCRHSLKMCKEPFLTDMGYNHWSYCDKCEYVVIFLMSEDKQLLKAVKRVGFHD